ncbi:MAG: glycosyltransferase family 2 protein [Janthinobacterium lividum]
MPPQISIVIPAYNAEAYLAWTLDSVLAQTVTAWELLIVDDGSADRTAAIAEFYARQDPRICLISQANAGVSAARNFGFDRSDPSTEFLIFLDADDVWEPSALAVLLETLGDHPEAPAAYGLARYIGKAGEPIELGICEGHQQFRIGLENGRVIVWPPERPTTFAVEAVMERVMTSGTVLIRRLAFQSAGLFDVHLRMWEDWDFWLRLSRVGGLIFRNTLVLGYRRHDTNISGQLDLLEAGEWRVRYQLLESVKDDPFYLQIAFQALAYRHRCAVGHRLQSAKSRCLSRHLSAAVSEIAGAGKHLIQFLYLRRAERGGIRLH